MWMPGHLTLADVEMADARTKSALPPVEDVGPKCTAAVLEWGRGGVEKCENFSMRQSRDRATLVCVDPTLLIPKILSS